MASDRRDDGTPAGEASTGALLEWVRGVAMDFGTAPSLPALLRSIVDGGRSIGLTAAAVSAIEGPSLRIVAAIGFDEETASAYGRLPLAVPLPGTDAARLGIPVYLGSRDAFRDRYPTVVGLEPSGFALAVAPLHNDGATLGVLTLMFDRAMVFGAETRLAIESLAGMCAAALGLPLADVPQPESTDLADRVAALERDLGAMRELIGFLGAVASQRLS